MKNYNFRIEYDIDPTNPREQFDSLGTMVCFHSKYQLGDEESKEYYHHDHFIECLSEIYHDDYKGLDYEKAASREILNKYIILPIYAYIHSGITVSTSKFNSVWDSGQVGYIYVSKEDVRKEYGWNRITKERQAKWKNTTHF